MLLCFVKRPDADSVSVHGEGECDGLMSIQLGKARKEGALIRTLFVTFFCLITYYIDDIFL